MKMTKETIVKEDGRLLTYYLFTDAPDDTGIRRHGDAGMTREPSSDTDIRDPSA